MWQQWVNAILGIWVIIAPWLGFAYTTLAWIMLVTGMVIAVLGFWGAASAGAGWVQGYGAQYEEARGARAEQEMEARAGGAGPISPEPTQREPREAYARRAEEQAESLPSPEPAPPAEPEEKEQQEHTA